MGKFNFFKNKIEIEEKTIDEKLKSYELQTHKEILKIISKLPRSRRDTFLDRLTGNIFILKTLTEEEKKELLEKYEAKEYEFILNIHKSLEEQKQTKEKIKERYEKPNLEKDEQETSSEEDFEEGKEEENTNWFPEEETEEGEESEDSLMDGGDIPEDNWNDHDVFCEKCFTSFRLTDEEFEKVNKKELKEISCKKCNAKVNMENMFFNNDFLPSESEEETSEKELGDGKDEK
jgi:hypothetical protein